MHNDLHYFPSEDSNVSSFLKIIQKLVESNASLNEMIKTERRNNTVLANENSGLKLEIQKMKTKMCTQIPCGKERNIASAQPKPQDIANDSGQVFEVNESVEQRLAKQLREVQKLKHEEFKHLKSTEGNEESSCSITQNYVNKTIKPSTTAKNAGSATTEKDNGTRKVKNSRKNRQQNKQLKSKITCNAAENGGNKNANSSTTNVNGKTAPVNKKILILGDSHVRRLNDCKLLPDSIVAKGIGGRRSNQIISRHKQTINSELTTTDEVIIHIGSNNVSKGIQQEKIVENVHSASKRLKDINPDIKISVSSVFYKAMIHPRISELLRLTGPLSTSVSLRGGNTPTMAISPLDTWIKVVCISPLWETECLLET